MARFDRAVVPGIALALLATATMVLPGSARQAPALAFPGAVGFGAGATGGTGGSVVHVTNLNDTGAGSFRDAVSAGHRVVEFDVSGYVRLSSAVSVASNLTIDGTTAPAPGIGIMAREVSFSGSSNDIVRGIRFRQGDLDPDTSDPVYLAAVAAEINNRPRKIHGWKKPSEVFTELLASDASTT